MSSSYDAHVGDDIRECTRGSIRDDIRKRCRNGYISRHIEKALRGYTWKSGTPARSNLGSTRESVNFTFYVAVHIVNLRDIPIKQGQEGWTNG